MKTKINLDYIKKFNPCKSGIDRFIKEGYENFDGDIIEFLNLEGILFQIKNGYCLMIIKIFLVMI